MIRQGGPILIVDDDPWTRYALARVFGHWGLSTVAAATLGDGLALLETKPSCIILDLNLPDGCGEAILRTVREEGLTCRVVVCTVIADPVRLEGVLRLAPDAVFAKPVEAADLAAACCD